jgi:hypothetical protein
MGTAPDRIEPLGRLGDFQVAQDDPDVRGWEVVSEDGTLVGRVGELLVDTQAMKVRYLEVEVDPALVAGERHVLVPIGYARLDPERDRVLVDGLRPEELQRHPAYQDVVDPEFESSVRGAFTHGRFMETVDADAAAAGREREREEEEYAREAFDEGRFFAPRRGRVVDPLAEARWEQVRGDEAGIRREWSGGSAPEGVTRPTEPGGSSGAAPSLDSDNDIARNGLTGGMGDPGGER